MYKVPVQTVLQTLSKHGTWQHWMFVVHSLNLVGHQQMFSVLTQSSSLGAGEMSCHIAVWVGQRQRERRGVDEVAQSDTCRWFHWLLCFEIRSNLWMGWTDGHAGIASAWIPDTTKRKERRAGKDPRRSQSFEDNTVLWGVGAIFWGRQTKREKEIIDSSPDNRKSSLLFYFKQI